MVVLLAPILVVTGWKLKRQRSKFFFDRLSIEQREGIHCKICTTDRAKAIAEWCRAPLMNQLRTACAGADKDRAISLIAWFVRCSKQMLCIADTQYFSSCWCIVEVITGMVLCSRLMTSDATAIAL